MKQIGHARCYLWPSDDPNDVIDLSNDVIGFGGGRLLDQPAGSFTIDLLPRTSDNVQTPADISRATKLYQRLDVNNVVSLGYDEDGGIALLLVDRIVQTRNRAGPGAAMGLQLSCSTFGKALASDSVILASIAAQGMESFLGKIRAALGDKSLFLAPFAGAEGVIGPVSAAEQFAAEAEAKLRVPTLASAFSVFHSGLAGALPQPPPKLPTSKGAPTFIGADVGTAVRWILDNAPSLNVPLFRKLLGGSGLASDYIGTNLSVTTWNAARIWDDSLSTFSGSVWDFIRGALDSDFYEVRLEYLPPTSIGVGAIVGPLPRSTTAIPRMELIVRPKPFDEPGLNFAPTTEDPGITWDSLRTTIDGFEAHDIGEELIFSESLGYGDGSTASYYLVTAAHDLIGNDQAVKDGLAYPLIDTWATKKYGTKAYNARVTLLNADIQSKSDGSFDYDGIGSAEVFEFRNRLFNWYRLNGYWEEGSITVVGSDRYRPGDPVRLPWRPAPRGGELGMTYYCVGVQWSWRYGGHYLCTLQLTRGHNAGMVEDIKASVLADAPPSNPTHYAAAGGDFSTPSAGS